ncbi:hypothetical protein YW3DRAFT_07095 [Streptomyces sp. MnatMP-M77]|nr:hypothetical protein YW3DRAFT_07095 [Streptomyces sp. MnatMP-M77]
MLVVLVGVRASPTCSWPFWTDGFSMPSSLARCLTAGAQRAQRIVREEPAHLAHRAYLECEAELVARGATPGDQTAVDVVQEEELLQLGAGRLLGELSVYLSLLISWKLHRHERTVASPGT